MSGNKLKNSKRIFSQDGFTASTDTRIYNLENNVYKVTYYEIISGASGTLTVPSQATINQDEFGLSGNAILSKININNKPTYESPTTLGGVNVTASLNPTTAAWAVSGAYTDLYVALIYSIDIKAEYFSNLDNFYIIETASLTPKGLQNLQDVTNLGNITTHPIEADYFVTTGGTSSDFVKGDGSLDNNTYLTSASITGFVPYTGATADVNLGTYNLTTDHIALNVNPSGAGFVVGATQWNNTLGSSETLLKGGSVILKNGIDLVARIVNKVIPNTTLTKAAYQVVKVSGAQGQRLAVDFAQANNDNNSADTLGIVTETIATNQEGFIMTMGQLENINTTGSLQGETWNDGDVLYLSPTTPGAITNIKPTGLTGHIVVLGYVEHAHSSQGKIYVKIMNGWELDELHNVYINLTTLANNDLLTYDSVSSLWKNKPLLTTLGYTPENVANKATDYTTVNNTLYPTLQATENRYALKESELNSGGIITIGTFGGGGTNNDIRISAANWYIQSTALNYFTSGNTDFLDIVPAVIGEQRYIGFYGTTSNTITKVEGNEDILATFPTQPANTALIGYVLVTDAGISTTPNLSGYLLKASKATQATNLTGSNDTTYVTPLANAIKENVNRKSSSYTLSSTTTYANTKALVDGLATKQNVLGYTPVPDTRNLTINGTTYDLTADRTWTISTASNVAIKDEGTTLTSAVTSINFTGASVTATTVGSDVTVDVSGTSSASNLFNYYNFT